MKRSSRQIGFLLPAALMLLALPACRKVAVQEPEEEGTEIGIKVMDEAGPRTRAASMRTDFSGDDDSLNDANLTTYIYKEGETSAFESQLRATWFAAGSRWFFCQAQDNKTYVRHFWPPTGEDLNFFAYVPYNLDNTCVTYTGYADLQPTVTCTNLPLTSAGQNNYNSTGKPLREFAWAFKQESKGNEVELPFKHPFARIILRLSQADRGLTLNNVSFLNIFNNGTCTGTYVPSPESFTAAWTPSGSNSGNMVVSVGKTMPSTLHIGLIDGPFLVMPQSFKDGGGSDTNLRIAIDYTPSGGEATTVVKTVTQSAWEPGMSYTYTLNLGKSSEQITVDIGVTAWIDVWDSVSETGIDVD